MTAGATSADVFYTPIGTTVTSKAHRILGYRTLNDSTAPQYAIAQLSRGTGPTLIETLTECFYTGQHVLPGILDGV